MKIIALYFPAIYKTSVANCSHLDEAIVFESPLNYSKFTKTLLLLLLLAWISVRTWSVKMYVHTGEKDDWLPLLLLWQPETWFFFTNRLNFQHILYKKNNLKIFSIEIICRNFIMCCTQKILWWFPCKIAI